MIFILLNEKTNLKIRQCKISIAKYSIAKFINIGLKVLQMLLHSGLTVMVILNKGEITRITFKKRRKIEVIEYLTVFIWKF